MQGTRRALVNTSWGHQQMQGTHSRTKSCTDADFGFTRANHPSSHVRLPRIERMEGLTLGP